MSKQIEEIKATNKSEIIEELKQIFQDNFEEKFLKLVEELSKKGVTIFL